MNDEVLKEKTFTKDVENGIEDTTEERSFNPLKCND